MSRSQLKILSQLASSPNDVASGLAQCMEALRLVSSLPRSSPIMVEYSGMKGSIIKAFGREHLSRVPFRTVYGLVKASMELPDDSRIMYAAFYREDGTVDPAKVLIDEDSWKELVPYVHTLHIEDDRQANSVFTVQALSSPTAQSARSSPSPSPAMASPTRSLNSNANTFIPSKNTVTFKSQDGTKLNLQALRKGMISPA
ncbi:uncharacterized protein HD556DRAFT_229495 [Suillus plorans]|uniref:Uncharacterized protein n=1 Tax=Suillus plorans TaxID=116603 RepID=A0A9P7DM53_9AGAM|nr:uncharacterized protein HD556DRAFT_229495 [Suillus plorans]KAG1798249.1 hypothetical protein HD556DRAFT_229495 [Suillus plorans]